MTPWTDWLELRGRLVTVRVDEAAPELDVMGVLVGMDPHDEILLRVADGRVIYVWPAVEIWPMD